MTTRPAWIIVGAAAGLLAGCATGPRRPATAFIVQTTPAGASLETTRGFRCTTPCQAPLGPYGFVATVTLLGYKPVQIPVAAGQNPGTITVKLMPQDPGAGAPNPVGAR